MSKEPADFESVKSRLDEIAELVAQDGISLDEALALYEEAVKLGLSACDLSESDLLPEDSAEASADNQPIEVADGDDSGSVGQIEQKSMEQDDKPELETI